jgi:NCS1 family nucleobase:cation symporter-1
MVPPLDWGQGGPARMCHASSDSTESHSHLWNPDLAPTDAARRTWSMWHIAALWVGMSVCITTYTLASSMIDAGMTWWQALLTVTLGNVIVLVPMVLNAHAGTKYGIPFPVFVRSSFGTLGANVAAMMRALVACGWFGIQTWIGGSAIYTLHAVIFHFEPVQAGSPAILPVIGLSWGQLGCFFVFWVINVVIIILGTESIKWLEALAAPFLLAVGLGLLVWGVVRAGGLGVVLSPDTVARIRQGNPRGFNFWVVFWPSLTAMVGYWSTVALNIPDFTRYARSQRDQVIGQALGLPTTMALFAFIGIAVTAATVVIFGEPIWEPVTLIGRFDNALVVGFALFTLTIATLSTNIAANVVSPANDISNLCPRLISFRLGGVITAFVGVLIFPWRLYSDLGNYIFTWLIGYSGLLGAIGGVMIADYFLLRRTRLDVAALYDPRGEYAFGGSGVNWRAMAALAAAILPNVPGFLDRASNGAIEVLPGLHFLYPYAWFVSFAIAFAGHLLLSAAFPAPRPGERA